MAKKKEFKHTLLVIIFVVIMVFAAFIFFNKPVENVSDAEHFLVKSGFDLGDYFKSYQIAAVVKFMNEKYSPETVAAELNSVFTFGNGNGKKTDDEFIKKLADNMELDVVKEAASKMIDDFDKSLQSIPGKAEQDAYKAELFQRLRGYLVEYNKERLRLGAEK
jgi:uncharacterized protein YxeA